MNQCRVCLTKKKNLRSVFDLDHEVTYADMITALVKVKINENDKITDKICRICRNKIVEFYVFKQQIERSDFTLRNLCSQSIKRLCFNNWNEMIAKLEIDIKPVTLKKESIENMVFEGDNFFNIIDTTIKKVAIKNSKENDKNPVPILDFLKTMENDSDRFSEFGDFSENSYSNEENTPLSIRRIRSLKCKNKNNNKVQNRIRRNRSVVKQVPVFLKPVYLNDITAYTGPIDRKNKKSEPNRRLDICPYCGKTCTHLKTHLLIHTGEKKFKCELCPSTFYNATRLNYHKLMHNNDRKYKCDQCIASFVSKGSLKTHMLKHQKEMKFICEICTKSFKRLCALNRHSMIHNSARKNIKCELCNMTFFDNTRLRHHMRVHTGERPFKCEICSQPYSYKHDFNRHCFKKHGVFLKQRQVYVMNEEVLKKERKTMKELMLRAHGIIKDGEPENPFKGPHAAMAFEQAMQMIKTQQFPVDLCTESFV